MDLEAALSDEMQATFLTGGAEVALNPALREELEGLDIEAVALRCRRNGLSHQGDREAMTQRLIALRAYLGDGIQIESQILRRPRIAEEPLPMVPPPFPSPIKQYSPFILITHKSSPGVVLYILRLHQIKHTAAATNPFAAPNIHFLQLVLVSHTIGDLLQQQN